MTATRRLCSILLGPLVVAVALVGVAWACTPAAQFSLSTVAAPAGTAVSVEGSSFPANQDVSVRWNSAGGPVLGSGKGPSFTTTVTIPDADPGIYYIVATTTNPDGSPGWAAVRSFQVVASSEPVEPEQTPSPPPPRILAPIAPLVAGSDSAASGRDAAKCLGRTAKVVGTPGNDVLEGTPGRDVIAGLGGNDVIRGAGAGDRICGGSGRDSLKGGGGPDRIAGGAGADRLNGGAGNDLCVGGRGRDRLARCER